jgi:RNA polymerase sigma-70 factor (ECF subfamily)
VAYWIHIVPDPSDAALDLASGEELMTRVQRGEREAFEALIERFKGPVYSLALSILRSPEDAEEAAQDTFLKLYRARDQFDPLRALAPWLLRIAGNTCRDLLRRRRVARLPGAQSTDSDHLEQVIVDPASLGREWHDAQRNAIRHEIGSLSEKLRLPLLLKYINGSTNRQIADTLGISVSNVKVRLARAKDVLQSRLGKIVEG